MRLFKQELSACEGQNFQAEFVEVEKVLSSSEWQISGLVRVNMRKLNLEQVTGSYRFYESMWGGSRSTCAVG